MESPHVQWPGIPSLITSSDGYTHELTRKWSEGIASHTGFIFVTPQCNWGYPASIKNAIDYLFNEWKGKLGMVVSYGGHGGGKAAQQLCQVLQGLRMQPVEPLVALMFPTKEFMGRAATEEDLGLIGDGGIWGDGLSELLVRLHFLCGPSTAHSSPLLLM